MSYRVDPTNPARGSAPGTPAGAASGVKGKGRAGPPPQAHLTTAQEPARGAARQGVQGPARRMPPLGHHRATPAAAAQAEVGTRVPTHDYMIRFLDAAGIERQLIHRAPADLPLDDLCACFARGTLIDTPTGPVAIEDLSPGDPVRTKDDGFQPITWISSCRLIDDPDDPRLPIRIRADAMGELRPMQDLVVTRRFRFLLKRESVRALFGQDEMLSPVASFVDGENITELHGPIHTDFFNLMLGNHQIINANGLETESFHPGTYGIATMSTEMRQHLARMLPHMAGDLTLFGPVARQRLRSFEAELLLGV